MFELAFIDRKVVNAYPRIAGEHADSWFESILGLAETELSTQLSRAQRRAAITYVGLCGLHDLVLSSGRNEAKRLFNATHDFLKPDHHQGAPTNCAHFKAEAGLPDHLRSAKVVSALFKPKLKSKAMILPVLTAIGAMVLSRNYLTHDDLTPDDDALSYFQREHLCDVLIPKTEVWLEGCNWRQNETSAQIIRMAT